MVSWIGPSVSLRALHETRRRLHGLRQLENHFGNLKAKSKVDANYGRAPIRTSTDVHDGVSHSDRRAYFNRPFAT